jgi:hypothetical protein
VEHESAYGGIVLEPKGLLRFLNLLRDSVCHGSKGPWLEVSNLVTFLA